MATTRSRAALVAALAAVGLGGLAAQAEAASETFTTAGVNRYVVPDGVTNVYATVRSPSPFAVTGQPGRGATVRARIPVTGGERLLVVVGQAGATSANGQSSSRPATASYVSGLGSPFDRLVFAGGGGEAGYAADSGASNLRAGGAGGDAGLVTPSSPAGAGQDGQGAFPGRGGTPDVGGAPGAAGTSGAGTAGQQGPGGLAGVFSAPDRSGFGTGGAGGGGLYGGGGGGAGTVDGRVEAGGGGGGASAVASPSAVVDSYLNTVQSLGGATASVQAQVTISTDPPAPRPTVSSVSPTSLDFGALAIGQQSAGKVLTITNGTDKPLLPSVSGGSSDGVEPSFDPADNTCAQGVDAHSSCTVTVRVRPLRAGVDTASFQVALVDPTTGNFGTQYPLGTVSLRVTGTGPEATVSPSSVAFGSQAVSSTGGDSSVRDITVRNSGTAPLAVTSYAVADVVNFKAVGGSCPAAPFTLQVGASCTVRAVFTPGSVGAKSTTLTVTTDAAIQPDPVALTGTGVYGAALDLSPASQRVDPTRSVPVTATVTRRDGGAAISGGKVQFSATGASPKDPTVVTTGSDGKATFNVTGFNAGTTTVTACFDDDGDGVYCEDGEPKQTATVTVVAPSLELTPASTTATVGDQVSFTARVVQGVSGQAVGGNRIHFQVTGPNAQAKDVDLGGSPPSATLTYTGANAGTDTILACVDDLGDGSCGEDDTIRSTATATFAAPDPRTQVDATAGKASVRGTVDCDVATANAKKRPFTMTYRDAKGASHTFTASTDGSAYRLSKCSSTSAGTKHIGVVRGTLDGGSTSYELAFTFVDGGEGGSDQLGVQLKKTGSSTLVFSQAVAKVTQGDVNAFDR